MPHRTAGSCNMQQPDCNLQLPPTSSIDTSSLTCCGGGSSPNAIAAAPARRCESVGPNAIAFLWLPTSAKYSRSTQLLFLHRVCIYAHGTTRGSVDVNAMHAWTTCPLVHVECANCTSSEWQPGG
eukprot:365763-Chlamydomonas_euryale.AAC.17